MDQKRQERRSKLTAAPRERSPLFRHPYYYFIVAEAGLFAFALITCVAFKLLLV